MGGVLIIFTIDHCQIQPIQGRPFLISCHVIPLEVVRPVVAIFGYSRNCVAILMVTNVAVETDFVVESTSYVIVPVWINHGLEVIRVGHVAHTVQIEAC